MTLSITVLGFCPCQEEWTVTVDDLFSVLFIENTIDAKYKSQVSW